MDFAASIMACDNQLDPHQPKSVTCNPQGKGGCEAFAPLHFCRPPSARPPAGGAARTVNRRSETRMSSRRGAAIRTSGASRTVARTRAAGSKRRRKTVGRPPRSIAQTDRGDRLRSWRPACARPIASSFSARRTLSPKSGRGFVRFAAFSLPAATGARRRRIRNANWAKICCVSPAGRNRSRGRGGRLLHISAGGLLRARQWVVQAPSPVSRRVFVIRMPGLWRGGSGVDIPNRL